MLIVVFIFSLFVFFKTIFYAYYELKKNKNIVGGIVIILLSLITLILPCYMVYIR